MKDGATEPAFDWRVCVCGVAASLVLSTLHVWFDPLINPDGVVYLVAANVWLDAGYAAAAKAFPLPIYPVLIGIVHALSGASLLTSAHVLDALLIALIVFAVQRLVWRMGGDFRVQLIAVLLVLLLPELNGFRSFLLRNFGYWALWLLALAALIRYAGAPTWKRAATFFALCLGAVAFRLEGFTLLLLMPLSLLVGRSRQARTTAMLYAPALLAVVFAAGTWALWFDRDGPDGWLEPTVRHAANIFAEGPSRLRGQLDAFGSQILTPGFSDYAAFGLAGAYVAMLLVHLVLAASVPLAVVAITGLWRGTLGPLDRRALPILLCAALLVVLELAAVLASRGLVQTRYAMPAGFVALVISAFVIDDWLTRATTPTARRRLRILIVLGVLYFVGEAGFGLFNSKQHYLDTSDWLAQRTPRTARILSNEPRVVYLANRPFKVEDVIRGRDIGLDELPVDRYGWFAIHLEADDDALRLMLANDARLQLVATFENRKGDEFVVYETIVER